MYHYLFTNDLRISDLTNKLKNAAVKIYSNTVPNPSDGPEQQSENNNIKALLSYFNLKSTSNCNEYVRNGKERDVIVNFIKKFQYPNYRTRASFESANNDGIILAPLREMVKILYVSFLQEGPSGYLSKEEILNFIFFNSEVAKVQHPNYIEVYNQIKDYRQSNVLPSNVAPTNERFWNDQDRQLREMLNILAYVGFLHIQNNRYFITSSEQLNTREKADLYEVLTTSDYWFGNTQQSYEDYFDLPPFGNTTQSSVEYNNVLDEPIQRILFGPPGTGKSYIVTEIIKMVYPTYDDKTVDNPYVYRTVVHPEYSYFDFVGNIMPVSHRNGDNVEINYEFQRGLFTQALQKAFEEPDKDIFIVLEEMSRGNIVAVFGDIFQLLDRKEDGTSEYAVNHSTISDIFSSELEGWNNSQIYLPANLHIIGTVNTSDQNVFVMDTAFKRRFDFEYVDTDPVEDLNKYSLHIDSVDIDWNEFYPILNNFIVEQLDLSEDKQIGQFFIKFKEANANYNNDQILNKLLQYLWNDVHLAKLTSNSLFKNEIKSYGKLYKRYKDSQFNSVLSPDFINYFTTTLAAQRESASNTPEISPVENPED
ncbi:AAA family ATPase [Lysinibacillus xylanilyticus]|uniref:McrB family protein n=1 Tax=Lysinibacillus xylanilyticus TaxID=582475 RepID=UPI002B24694D|nr:AAA family ATPase [Lysinibacillus xylanilyticus]MEB2300438.1 AAA family ATPase [Lysinibacillus xylanilyticus]